MREQIIKMFKNNVSQRKIGRDLDILPSTVHNIIKRFKESGGISELKGRRKPKLNLHLADAFIQSDVQGREYSSYEQ